MIMFQEESLFLGNYKNRLKWDKGGGDGEMVGVLILFIGYNRILAITNNL